MAKEPLISVIIPVYNTEKFLRRCLESVEKQSYKNLEVIIVDDATNDNSNAIIQEFMDRDKRYVLVKHASNKGLFQARITGVKASKGEYFAFIDSDDHISMDYYRLLVNKAVATDSDIVIASFADEYEDGRIEYYNYDNIRFRDINLNGSEVYETFMRQRGSWFGWHTVWNKIYKKKIWEQSVAYFEEFSDKNGRLIMTEDIAFSCVFWRYAQKVVNVRSAFYFYCHHDGQSVCNNDIVKFSKNVYDVAHVFDFFKSFLKKENIYAKYESDFKNFIDLYIEFWTGNVNPLPQSMQKQAMDLVKKVFGKTIDFYYKDHYHYTKRTSIKTFYWYENIKKDICSSDIKIVSFDIFDTLILRPFLKPSDLFYLLNEDFNALQKGMAYIDFHKFRVEAENYLRKKVAYKKEVLIDDIYTYIGEIFNLTKDQVEFLKNKEKSLEIKFAKPRESGKELYELARHMGKRIVFTSDIYLDITTVKSILQKCGYEADEWYISSDFLEQKATGKLYSILLDKEGVQGDQVLHIGDNWDVDVTNAQNSKIRTHYLPSTAIQLKGENLGIFSGKSFSKIFGVTGKQYMGESALSFLGIRCMLALIANKIFDNPYLLPFSEFSDFNSNPYFVGYYTLGMHLLAVTRWIREIAAKEKRETVHFVSRDGYLPMKAFEILEKYNKTGIKANYLHISRKATALFQNSSVADLESFIGSFHSLSSVGVKKVLDTFSELAKDEKKKMLDKDNKLEDNKGNLYSCYGCFVDFDEACKFGKYIYTDVLDSNKIESLNMLATEHFEKLIKPNDILFDLGYRANKEHILSSLIKRPVDCLYIYTYEGNAIARAINRGFSMRTFYDYTPTVLAATREILFSELSPSCVSYDYKNSMQPVFEENYTEHYFNNFIINTIQEGALDFVTDFEETFSTTIVPNLYRGFDASLPYEYFMNYAPKYDREMLGCVTFEDDAYAGKSFSLMEDWEKAINYHNLNIYEDYANNNANYKVESIDTNLIFSEDGLMHSVMAYVNKKYPKESKKRERLKKFVKLLIR